MTKRKRSLSVLACLLPLAGVVVSAGAQSAALERDDWRGAALKQYDRNSDGRLSDAERETMRQDVFGQRRRTAGRGRGMMFPPEIVAKYDKDGDGSLDESEGQAAREGMNTMFQELRKKYDANGNGEFEPPEVERLQADVAAGKLEDVPRFFTQMLSSRGGRPRFGHPPSSAQRLDLRQADKDSDGRLNEEELAAARAARENPQKTTGQTPPGSRP